jgi:hypothetical protein
MEYKHFAGIGHNVVMSSCNHAENQVWWWEEGGTERIVNRKDSNLCLQNDIKGWLKKNNVQMASCRDAKEQKWYWDGVRIRSRADNLCLTFAWEVGNVFAHTCETNQRNQEWFFT